MAARKSRAIKPGTMGEEWRTRIQTSMIVNRLQEHIKGEIKLEATQVSAALGLLKKTAPDLQAVQLTGEGGGPLVIKWEG